MIMDEYWAKVHRNFVTNEDHWLICQDCAQRFVPRDEDCAKYHVCRPCMDAYEMMYGKRTS